MPPADRIRNVAVGLVVRDGHALVEIYPATALHAGWARGHEVVHVFAVKSAALDDLPLDLELPVLDNHTTARWVALDSLAASKPLFHPHGVVDMALQLQRAHDASPSARPGHESTD